MKNEQALEQAASYGRWLQSVYGANNEIVVPGLWDPKRILRVLTSVIPVDSWIGKRVLDIGACNGGLSIELARLGAIVHAIEPNPEAQRQYGFACSILPDARELDIDFESGSLFTCNRNIKYDVTLFLGLVYHFRYPQLVLDYLAGFNSDIFFVSSQTHRSSDLVMQNRRSVVSDYGKRILAGYHPSRSLMRSMIEWAGFSKVSEIITEDTGRDFEDRFTNITNSAYFVAHRGINYNIEDLKDFYI